jgi:hypothetical protein
MHAWSIATVELAEGDGVDPLELPVDDELEHPVIASAPITQVTANARTGRAYPRR